MNLENVAIVILNYNGGGYLKKFLPKVIQYSDNAAIVVIDNQSTDNSVSLISEKFPSVRTIILQENLGFAGGYNAGLKVVKADFYVLLNSDVAVSKGWLYPLIELLKSEEKIAACQPKIKSYHEPKKFEYAGAAGGFIDTFGYPFCRGRIFDSLEEDVEQYNDTCEIFWATGACLAIKSSLYHDFGGLDDFFLHTWKKSIFAGA